MIVYKELASLERELGFSAKTLYGISNHIGGHYREVKIPKQDGGVRTLSVPDKILKKVQRAIADKFLAYEPVSRYAKAYKIASGVRKNASPHVGKPKLLKLDVEKFFDNILYSTVKERVFSAEKYSEPIRVLLSMLCYHGDGLPQGAPTSPAITNIVMRDFDEKIGEWCGERGIAYTRYCDDMTFSGDFDETQVIEMVSAELRGMGLRLNKRKTAVIPKGKRQTVTGVVVNGKLSVPSEYKRRLRQEVFYCQKFGVEEHIRRVESDLSAEKYLVRLLGKIHYALHICPEDENLRLYRKTIVSLLEETKR